MNSIKELTGKKVTGLFEYYCPQDDEEYQVEIACKVISVHIDDYYFEEKNEPIYISFNLTPIEDYDKEVIDHEDFINVPLHNIRQYNG
jgi:hypothetical protein